MTKKRLPKQITNKPAPLVPGLYSVQAVAKMPNGVDVSAYRHTLEDAVSWKDDMTKTGIFSSFLLRHAADAWDVYGENGELTGLCSDVITKDAQLESAKPGHVDLRELDEDARSVLGCGVCRFSAAEAHVGASAACHSNLAALMGRFVRDAEPANLAHVFVVDSGRWPFRVAGLYGDVSKMREESQNLFLDCYPLLREGLPLDEANFAATLASRLVHQRRSHLGDVVAESASAEHMDPDDVLSLRLNVSTMPHTKALAMATKIVALTRKYIIFNRGAEIIGKVRSSRVRKCVLEAYEETIG